MRYINLRLTYLLTYLLCARKNEACIILYVYIYYFMSVEMFCSYMFYALEKTAVVIIALIYDVWSFNMRS